MRVLYLILFVVSALGVAADVILRYVENIKGFGIEGRDGKLFRLPPRFTATIPFDRLLPDNVTTLLIAVTAASGLGGILALLRVPWFLSLPCAGACGLLLCFIWQYHAKNIASALKRENLPKGEAAAGLEGYCSLEFADGYGKVTLTYKERGFEVYAGCSEDSDGNIAVNDKVVALYESDGYYFVVKPNDIFTGIDTKF
jgi:hypothetical protein